ncbi:helix-turn-helix domain-containing protein [Planctomycetota bacterium]
MIPDVLTIPTKIGAGAAVSDRPLGVRDFLIGPENAVVVESIVRPFLDEVAVEYFPMFLFGKTGTGKSHLIQTLASFVTRNAVITDANAFSAECTEAGKVDEVAAFERRFLQCGYLFFDDIDTLYSKPVAQQRLMRILETRTKASKPTIFTARKPPLALKLSAGLISRLSQGVIVPLEYPSNATREQLLRVFAERSGVPLENDAIMTLAEQNHTAPALLSQLLALRTADTSASQLEQIRLPNTAKPTESFSPRTIIQITAKYYGLSPKDLAGSSRRKQLVLARSMAMYLLRVKTELSYQDIGLLFGKRDHSTVMHACRKIEALIKHESMTQDAKSHILNRCEPEC